MELDDMKAAWHMLDRRMEQQAALNLHVLKDGKLDKARRGLWPLVWGQALQIACGFALILLSVSFWTAHHEVAHLLFAGLLMHVYGVLMILCAGTTLGRIHRIDYAAPVLAIQKQLTHLRRVYVRTSIGLGLAWWLLWLPSMMMLCMSVFDIDVYLNAPAFIWVNIALGSTGLLATWWFYRWACQPSRPRLAKFMRDSVVGSCPQRTQSALDEIARFEQN